MDICLTEPPVSVVKNKDRTTEEINSGESVQDTPTVTVSTETETQTDSNEPTAVTETERCTTTQVSLGNGYPLLSPFDPVKVKLDIMQNFLLLENKNSLIYNQP